MTSASQLLLTSLCLLLLSAGAGAASVRRSRPGFLGMRGKRSVPALKQQLPFALLHQPPEQLPEQLPQQLHQLPSPQQLRRLFRMARRHGGRFVTRLEDKRAPNGLSFAGLRGRKREENEVLGKNVIEERVDKRMPSGFGGGRGKKSDVMQIEEQKKSSPNSFFGLRGKREERF